MKKFLLVVVGLLVAFGLGYVPQYLKVSRLTAEMQQTQDELQQRVDTLEERNRILTLHSALGMLLLEVENQNYGNARERSTDWFDQLRNAISNSTSDSTTNALSEIAAQRDQVTAMLTETKPEAAARLRQMYRALAAVVGGQ